METASRLHIDSELYQQAANHARQEGLSVSDLVEDLLRDYVDATDAEEQVSRVWARMDRSVQGSDFGFGDYDDVVGSAET